MSGRHREKQDNGKSCTCLKCCILIRKKSEENTTVCTVWGDTSDEKESIL